MKEIRIYDRTLTEADELSFKNRLDLARELLKPVEGEDEE